MAGTRRATSECIIRTGPPGAPARLRIVIADDHPGVLAEIRTLLEPEFEVVAEADTGIALMESARRARPDIVVSDLRMPGLSGIEAGRDIMKQGLCKAVVILTMYDDPQLVLSVLQAGIRGYVLKDDAGEELPAALYAVLSGATYLSRGVPLIELS